MAEDMPQNPAPQVAFRRSRFVPSFTSSELSTSGNQPPVAVQPAAPTVVSGAEEPRRAESRLASVTSAFGGGGGAGEQEGPFAGSPGAPAPGSQRGAQSLGQEIGDQIRSSLEPGNIARSIASQVGPPGTGLAIGVGTEFTNEMMADAPLSEAERRAQQTRMLHNALTFMTGVPVGPIGDLMETQTMQGLLSDPALQGPRPDISDPAVQRGLERDAAISEVSGGLFSDDRAAVARAVRGGMQAESVPERETPGLAETDAPSGLSGQSLDARGLDTKGIGEAMGDIGRGDAGPGPESGRDTGGFGGEGGAAKGGVVHAKNLVGPNPPGPDEGYHSIQSKEGVLTRPAMAKIGPQNLKVLNANPQAQAAVAHILEEYRQPKSRLAHVNGMMG